MEKALITINGEKIPAIYDRFSNPSFQPNKIVYLLQDTLKNQAGDEVKVDQKDFEPVDKFISEYKTIRFNNFSDFANAIMHLAACTITRFIIDPGSYDITLKNVNKIPSYIESQFNGVCLD